MEFREAVFKFFNLCRVKNYLGHLIRLCSILLSPNGVANLDFVVPGVFEMVLLVINIPAGWAKDADCLEIVNIIMGLTLFGLARLSKYFESQILMLHVF